MGIRLTSAYAFVDNNGVRQEFKDGAEIRDAALEAFVRRDTQSWEEIGPAPTDEPTSDAAPEPIEAASDAAVVLSVADVPEDLALLSYAALKVEARTMGIAVGGRKAVLLKRIEDALRVPESE